MTYQELVAGASAESIGSLLAFLPEIILSVTVVAILLLRMIPLTRRVPASLLALLGALLAAGWGCYDWAAGMPLVPDRLGGEIFSGMLVTDHLTLFFRVFLCLTLALTIWLTRITGVPDREDGPDLYTQFLGATIGMCVMASSNHLMMLFLGLELASVPAYVLAGLNKGSRRGSEAALKFAVYGAAAAGVMLYGLTLLAGALGSAHFPTMGQRLVELWGTESLNERLPVVVLGILFVFVGLAFKLSAVPFHFWCPDVFEGATAEVAGFLSVASKAAALGLVLRMTTAGLGLPWHEWIDPATATVATPDGLRQFWVGLIGLLATVTVTFGNLAAFGQTNIKRLLAYSTIAHAGYLLMPLAALANVIGLERPAAELAVSGLVLYLVIYLFMNVGAFAVVAFLRNHLQSERIDDYAGLIRRTPGLVVCFALLLISLIGLPPTAGFLAKVAIFSSLVNAGLYGLLLVGAVNTVVSLFYYLRVIRVMTFQPLPEQGPPADLPLVFSPEGRYTLLVTLPVVILLLAWDPLARLAAAAAG